MSPDLALALALADAADAISLGRFRASDLRVETKPDLTPVTEADRRSRRRSASGSRASARATACSARSSAVPAAARAAGSSTRSTAPGTTRAGIPVWATLIALEEDGVAAPGCRLGARTPPPLARRARRRRLGGRRSHPCLCSAARRGRRALVRGRTAHSGARDLAGTHGGTATSGPTCSWPREPSRRRRRGRGQALGPRRRSADRRGGRRPIQRSRRRPESRRRNRDLLERLPPRAPARRPRREVEPGS